MKVKIKKTSENFVMPHYATAGAACFDLVAAEKMTILPGSTATIDLGFKIEMEPGYFLEFRPRSGMATKKGILIPNSPATIDSDFRGDVKLCLLNTNNINFNVNIGDRIGQGMVRRYDVTEFELVDELSDTDRGEGGFGSTDTPK